MRQHERGWNYRQQVLEILRGYRQSQVLITCAKLGVFAALHAAPLGADDLAQQLKTNAAALIRLLNTACALGFLQKQGDTYANSLLATECLAAEGPYYLGNLVQRESTFYQRWLHLSEAVRTGRRPEENERDEDPTDWVRTFELALYDIARTAAPAVAETLEPLLPASTGRRLRVIDIGGGHGAYSIALAKRYPALDAMIFELPAAAAVAHEIIADSGIAEQVSVRVGDFKRDELGVDFDLALLFGILVSEPPEDALALLRKVHTALVPGGLLVIRGLYLNQDRVGPTEAALADVHMLLSTSAGAAYTLDDLIAWVSAAGFSTPDRVALLPPEQTSILVAQKLA